MSFDHERAFVTTILKTREIQLPLKHRITPEFLADSDTRDVYRWTIEQYQKHGSVPSRGMVREEFPEWKGLRSGDNLSALVDRVQERKLYADIQKVLKDVAANTRANSREGLQLLRKASVELSIRHSNSEDVDFSAAGDEIKRQYRINRRMKGRLGIPYPWASMNRATRGKQAGQFISVIGMAESMKTWLLLCMAEHTHTVCGRTPLLFTKEMSVEELQERLACLRTKINFDRYQDGNLPTRERKRFFRELDQLKDDPPFIITSIESQGVASLAEIRSKVEEYGADEVYIDGLYFLADDTEWGSFAMITRGVKDTARTLKIPFVCSSQANAEGQKASSNVHGFQTDIGFGRSLIMESDVMFKSFRTPKHREDDECMILSKKVRKGKPFRFVINAVPCTDFTEKYQMDESVNPAEQGIDEGGLV